MVLSWLVAWVSWQGTLDLVVAGVSAVIGLGIFGFVASILCSAAFLHNAKTNTTS